MHGDPGDVVAASFELARVQPRSDVNPEFEYGDGSSSRARQAVSVDAELDKVGQMVSGPRGSLRNATAGKIGERVGRVSNKYKVAKHFELQITDGSSATSARPSRSRPKPRSTASLRTQTTCPAHQLTSQAVVRVYKQLQLAERAYRTIKHALDVRRLRHDLHERVPARFFLRLLALKPLDVKLAT
jgi:hypothetical protein